MENGIYKFYKVLELKGPYWLVYISPFEAINCASAFTVRFESKADLDRNISIWRSFYNMKEVQ